MAAPRFFVPPTVERLAAGAEVALPDAVVHHALRVLRLGTGAPLVLFDGGGGEYPATLVAVGKGTARARIERFDAVEREWPGAVTLVQAIVASDPMEIVVRKAVELGVAAIEPVVAARSQGSAAAERRVSHWRQVAVSACEQCGRNRVPPIAVPVPFREWLRSLPANAGPSIMLDPGGKGSLAAVARARAPNRLVVGPEGGWTHEEVVAATARGIVLAHLGPRVLRAETAAIAALATVNAVVGDAS